MSRPAGPESVFGAIDIGASGGRVMAGIVTDDAIELDPVYRFDNGMTERGGHLRWDVRRIFDEVIIGLTRLAERYPGVRSIGVDTWAVDYGLIDQTGELIADPYAYRDDRTVATVSEVQQIVSAAELFAVNGLQHLPFNTIFQLHADQQNDSWSTVQTILLLPDLLGFWLTGIRAAEITNASTTGLLDARSRRWSEQLIERLELGIERFPPLVEPGETIGAITADISDRTGLSPQTRLCAVGSHDTASAVVGVPATGPQFGYISCGTWSLVGLELDRPVLSDEAQAAGFTNEGGVDQRIRFLRNVGGLWLLQESLRFWRDHDQPGELGPLLAEASELPSGGPIIDVDDEMFLAPGDMPSRISAASAKTGAPQLDNQASVVRCILDSLARGYADTLAEAMKITGRVVDVVHLVGGGSQNALLAQLTADACGVRVLAGPVEATALGNVCVQARAAGVLPATLAEIRGRLAARTTTRSYRPTEVGVARR